LIGQTLDTIPYQSKFAGTRILMTNGDNDPHVPQSRSEESKTVLENLGAEVKLVIYPGRPHVVQALELDLAKTFIFNS
jgi:phospholipase/carboxylesterase